MTSGSRKGHTLSDAVVITTRAWELRTRGEYGEAKQLLRAALEIHDACAHTSEADLEAYARTLQQMGLVHSESGEQELAASFYRRWLDLLEQSLGPTHWRTAEARWRFGQEYLEWGQPEKAVEILGHLIATMDCDPRNTSLDRSDFVADYAKALSRVGRAKEAELMARRAEELAKIGRGEPVTRSSLRGRQP